MDTQSSDEIAEEWVLAWSGKEPPSVGAVIGAPRLDWELPQEDPGLCLESIVKVLGRIDGSSPNPLLAALAAGPLEDLLAKNGGAVVDQVEVLARRNPKFRLLLNGVWDSTIKPEVLSKLAKYRDQRW